VRFFSGEGVEKLLLSIRKPFPFLELCGGQGANAACCAGDARITSSAVVGFGFTRFITSLSWLK